MLAEPDGGSPDLGMAVFVQSHAFGVLNKEFST